MIDLEKSDLEDRVWNLFQRPGAGPTREELRQALQTTRKPESEGAAFTLSPNEKCPFCPDGMLDLAEPCTCMATPHPPCGSCESGEIVCRTCNILISMR